MKSKSKKRLLAVVGPTGSGKTAVGMKLCKEYNGVIISADSRQVYKGMDIGTNKEGEPGTWQGETARIIDGVPQLLLDIIEPGSKFTLHDWLTEARRLCEKAWAAGLLPVVVGGTGLYVSALIDGYEVGEGRHSKKRVPVDFEVLVLEMDIDRHALYQKSDERFERVFDSVVDEAKGLLAAGVAPEWLEKIGLDYRFATLFIYHKMVREFAITDFQLSSRQYIRRQLTWWRHHSQPVKVTNAEQAVAAVKQFIN